MLCLVVFLVFLESSLADVEGWEDPDMRRSRSSIRILKKDVGHNDRITKMGGQYYRIQKRNGKERLKPYHCLVGEFFGKKSVLS